MAKIKDGVLILGKREQKALKEIKECAENHTDFNGSKQSKKIEQGLDLIDFILEITK